MSVKETLGSTGGIAAMAAAVAAVGLAYFLYFGQTPENTAPGPQMPMDAAQREGQSGSGQPSVQSESSASPPATASTDETSSVPEDASATVAEAVPEQVNAEESPDSKEDTATDAPAIALPRFSDMRLDAEGTAVIAGTAPADFEVQVREGEAALASAKANASGDFAMVFDLPPSGAQTGGARVLYLVALDGAGREYRSEQSAILTPPVAPAPVPEEVEVAAADVIAPDPASFPGAAQDVPEDETPSETAVRGTEPAEVETAELPETDGVAEAPDEAQTSPDVSEPQMADGGKAVAERPSEEDAGTAAHEPDVPATELAEETLVAEQPEPVGSASEAPSDAVPTVLLAGHEGVELLQPANASIERLRDRVVIDVISYSDDGSVSLSGRAAMSMPRADRVQVYLNNKPVQTTDIAWDGSWKMRLPPVKPGIYTLRVDQVDAAGKVVARFETPFKREDPTDLARMTPTDLVPGGLAASVITVQPGYTLWGIASDRYGSGFDYVQIFEANRNQIRDPDLIYPGQVFDLPDKEEDPAE
ncbi:LysM peptidoglycan-binding domain-containing protein [Aliiruegeria sabulilitoris]|uniref:LysM peptidoglycan-binding domain-containing protein n=1 Tax=Aliiruegeria sabulilitoris TaxID=1510458 RepID=UPI0009EB3AE0|nr:LysM peptidoglycan-binding domain-containing protein [Aliiruegeria sabulilitoris]NDR55282.1 LysM peptidoglycan-binding domain-containing protein [Pseudoruegeria sp. M32A2M]